MGNGFRDPPVMVDESMIEKADGFGHWRQHLAGQWLLIPSKDALLVACEDQFMETTPVKS